MITSTACVSVPSKVPHVLFLNMECEVVCEQYRAGRQTVLRLIAADTYDNSKRGLFPGEPVATATVNVPGNLLRPDEVAIKDYSENTGLLDALIVAGVVAKPHRYLPCVYQQIPVVRLLVDIERQAGAGE